MKIFNPHTGTKNTKNSSSFNNCHGEILAEKRRRGGKNAAKANKLKLEEKKK